MTNNNSSVRFEPELGEHNVQDKLTSDSITNTYKFEVEAETVFKRLAEDIYDGVEAGIREPLTNSITAVYKAIEDGYIENKSDGIILFELYDYDNVKRLKLRDNGVGMTRKEIDEIVSVIGTSTSRSSAHLTGKFGMGFLATWMLVGGVQGGFTMHTNPRGVEESPISGIWTSNSFAEIEEGELDGGFEPDEYGTEFDIMIDQDIEIKSIIEWINKYSEWSRIPILFRHYTEDGLTDEEFTPKNMVDMYDDIDNDNSKAEEHNFKTPKYTEFKYYVVDEEHFTAINSNIQPDGQKQNFHRNYYENVVLLDVPIDCRGELLNNNKYPLRSISIRIDSEIPVVVDGPHKGKYVVSESEAKELGDKYIGENILTQSDIVTPSPTGTRDVLQTSEKFTNWLTDKFYDIHYKNIAGILREVDSLDDYYDISPDERDEFHDLITQICDCSYQSVSKTDIAQIESYTDTTFDSDLKSKLPLFHNQSISIAEEDTKGVSKMSNRLTVNLRDFVVDNARKDNNVYMSHRITQEKSEFIWDSEKDHKVVRVESKNQDRYIDEFGWELLSNIDYETSLQMSDETREKYTTNEKEISNEIVKIHIDSHSTIKNIKADKLKDIMSKQETISDSNENPICKLILFKRGDVSISDYQNMASPVVATASVSSELYDYLIDEQNVWGANKAINTDIIIPASDGNKYNINTDITEDIVTHIVDEETIDDFRDEEFMKNVQEYIRSLDDTSNDSVYLPMSRFEHEFAYNTNSLNRKSSYRFKSNINTQSYKDSSSFPINMNDVELYINAMIDTETPESKALKTVSTKWSEGGKEIIEMFEKQR